MFREFRDFAMRGNVVDLAVGIIIGAAFTSIVNSLVNDVIMPPVGYLISGIDFSSLALQLAPERMSGDGKTLPPVLIEYGKFLNAVLSFFIVAWVVFLLVKGMNRLYQAQPAPGPAPSASEKLLEEIRDLLKQRS